MSCPFPPDPFVVSVAYVLSYYLYHCFLGLPSIFPFLTARRRPSLVLSLIRSLSSSANAARTVTKNLPLLVLTSILSCRLTKDTPLSYSSCISRIISVVLLPHRSSFQTHTPSNSFSRSLWSSSALTGRVFLVLSTSAKDSYSHSLALAYSCNLCICCSVLCSSVETLA